ncbi:MAG: hypothetical protein K6E91_13815 [Butyrivibrio sp.]|nr:hypothetical protein [Butyrivibrio sp.]
MPANNTIGRGKVKKTMAGEKKKQNTCYLYTRVSTAIQIYEEPDRIDGVNFWVKSLRFKVPMFKGTPNEFDTIEFRREFQPNGEHGETVACLTKQE